MLTFITNALFFFIIIPVIQARSLFARSFSGYGTYYDVGPGSCGSYNDNSENVAALNKEQMGYSPNPNENENCGRRVRVSGPNGRTITITIVDMCPACGYGSLDLSPAVYRQLGGGSAGRVRINWNWA